MKNKSEKKIKKNKSCFNYNRKKLNLNKSPKNLFFSNIINENNIPKAKSKKFKINNIENIIKRKNGTKFNSEQNINEIYINNQDNNLFNNPQENKIFKQKSQIKMLNKNLNLFSSDLNINKDKYYKLKLNKNNIFKKKLIYFYLII